jgi:hypothetical protein
MAGKRKLPFGYRMELGKVVVHTEEALAVQYIFQKYILGTSYSELVKHLREQDMPYDQGRCWNKNMVARILENRKYTGQSGWPSIIDAEIFEHANEKRSSKVSPSQQTEAQKVLRRLSGGSSAEVEQTVLQLLSSVIDLLQNAEKQYFVVHPFVEDLLIEPRSLYDYIHPVFTGMFIDKFPGKGEIVGGMNMPSYEEHGSVRASSDALLRQMHLAKYADRRLRQVLADARDMLGSEDKDMDFLLAYLPYAYVTGQTELLTDMRQALSKNARECIARFMDD